MSARTECIDENLAAALMEGRLDKHVAALVHEHTHACEACRQFLAELSRGVGSGEAAPIQIGRYPISHFLGAGGMGQVFVAEDPELHRKVAIKLMHADSPSSSERLLHEARALAKLRHPHVVTIYEVGRDQSDVFVVMELVEGVTLRQWLAQKPSHQAIVDVLLGVGRGLVAAHQQGLIHCDLKPENIMVGADNRAQILDFGLARAAQSLPAENAAPPSLEVDITQSKQWQGTPAYMAPEQFLGLACDERTDQFSFSVVLFEAFCGYRPFAGTNVTELAHAVTQGKFSRKIRKNKENQVFTARLEAICQRGLAPNPQDRFSSMQELLNGLGEKSTPGFAKHWPLVAASLLAGAALLSYFFVQKNTLSKPDAVAAAPGDLLAKFGLPPVQPTPLPEDPMAVTVHRLTNGLTVYISPNRKKPRIYSRLVFSVGSVNEAAGARGVAHLLEHMLFKGSDKIGTTDFAAETVHLDQLSGLYDQLAGSSDPNVKAELLKKIDAESVAAAKYVIPQEFESVARGLGIIAQNGQTQADETSFVADIPSHRFEQWARLEATRWIHPVFRLFHSEIGVVYAELRKLSAQSTFANGELWAQLFAGIYGDTAYANEIGGTYQDVLAEPFSAMCAFFDTWYVPNNASLFLAGDVDPDHVIPVLEREFSDWKPRALPVRKVEKALPRPKPDPIVIASDGPKFLTMAWPIPPAGHDDDAALSLLSELSQNQDVLAKTEQPNFAEILIQPMQFRQAGLLMLMTKVEEEQTDEQAQRVAEKVISVLQNGEFSDELLRAVILHWKTSLIRSYEANSSRTAHMAFFAAQGKSRAFAASWASRLESVTKADIVRVAKTYLTATPLVIRMKSGTVRKDPPPPVQATPLVMANGEQSEFGRELLAVEAVDLPLRLVWAGRDYHVRQTASGQVISVTNKDNDQFSVTLRWNIGSREIPLLCEALWALRNNNSMSVPVMTRDRLWYGQALSITGECSVDHASVSFEGVDQYFDSAQKQVRAWLSGAEFDDESWKQAAARYVAAVQQERSERRSLEQTVDEYQRKGKKASEHVKPRNAVLRSASREEAQKALSRLLGLQHETLYFGPRESSALQLGDSVLQPVFPPPPDKIQSTTKSRIAVLHTGPGQPVGVMIRLPLGIIAESEIPLLQIFDSYMSGGLSSHLQRAMREARGLVYYGYATAILPKRRQDESSVIISFTTESAYVAETIELALRVVADSAIVAEDFFRARKQVEDNYRANWISPRELPEAVSGWQMLGLTADPSANRFAALSQVTVGQLAGFLERLRHTARIISIAGDTSKLDVARLKKMAEVTVVTRQDLFPE